MNKKMIPVLVAVFMIIVILIIGAGTGALEKFSYSNEQANLYEYFKVSGANDTAILLNKTLIDAKAFYSNGHVYFKQDFVDEYINNHFYYDATENLILFTNDTSILSTTLGSTDYNFGGNFASLDFPLTFAEAGEVYYADEFLKLFANFDYAFYPDPNRVVINTSWGEETHASVKKNTQLRVLGGVKSAILKDLTKGDDVIVMEKMDTWSKVLSSDGMIGYVENKKIKEGATVAACPVTTYIAPTYTPISRGKKICLVWNNVTNRDANAYATSLLANTQGVNVISPTWFSLSDDFGSFTSLADSNYVATMHSMGIEVWGCVDNFTNTVNTANVVNVTTNRTRLIEGLISTAVSYGLDGINVDFESVSTEAADGYIQFLRELSIACHKNNLVLSADNMYLLNYSRAKQGEVCDYVVIMGYDEHVAAADGVGPNASIGFTKSGIEKTISEVPASKVINGIPFYSRLWVASGEIKNTAYGMQEIENFLNEKGVSKTWDEETCSNVAQFSLDGTSYAVWVEDSQSISAKLNAMQSYNLAGVAGWRLGQEKPEIWNEISTYMNY